MFKKFSVRAIEKAQRPVNIGLRLAMKAERPST
jgi:hypothetical protein